jgi:hypothetical protein
MKKYFVLFMLGGILVACNKDKFETKPQLTLKSVNKNEVPFNDNLVVTLGFTDKEGDTSDSLFVLRERLNRRQPTTPPSLDYKIPDFTGKTEGEFELNIAFLNLINAMPTIRIPGSNPVKYEIDTIRLKFVARDKEGNTSDTLVVNDIFVERR